MIPFLKSPEGTKYLEIQQHQITRFVAAERDIPLLDDTLRSYGAAVVRGCG
jgi:hypothetical protein